MNWDEIKGNWNQMKGSLKNTWAELTDDDLARVEGDWDTLVGILQERYGIAGDEAEKQIGKAGQGCLRRLTSDKQEAFILLLSSSMDCKRPGAISWALACVTRAVFTGVAGTPISRDR